MPLTAAYEPFGQNLRVVSPDCLEEITMRVAMILEHLVAQRARVCSDGRPVRGGHDKKMAPISILFLRTLLANLFLAIAGAPAARLLAWGEAQGAHIVCLVAAAWAVETLCPLRLSTPQKPCPTSGGASSASGASTPLDATPPASPPRSSPDNLARVLRFTPPRPAGPCRAPPVAGRTAAARKTWPWPPPRLDASAPAATASGPPPAEEAGPPLVAGQAWLWSPPRHASESLGAAVTRPRVSEGSTRPWVGAR
jgi:hypothetical protein